MGELWKVPFSCCGAIIVAFFALLLIAIAYYFLVEYTVEIIILTIIIVLLAGLGIYYQRKKAVEREREMDSKGLLIEGIECPNCKEQIKLRCFKSFCGGKLTKSYYCSRCGVKIVAVKCPHCRATISLQSA